MTTSESIDKLPRLARPREWLLATRHELLAVRDQLTTAGNHLSGLGWTSGPQLRATIESVDALRDQLLALAVDADRWRQRQEVERAARDAARAEAKAAERPTRAVPA